MIWDLERVAQLTAALGLILSLNAAARPGDAAHPIPIEATPFVHAYDTVMRPAVIERYDCRSDLSEAGGEVLYAIDIHRPGWLTAWVDGDNDSVDIDVHLLRGPLSLTDGTATGCLDRGNLGAAAEVGPGQYLVAVDTYESDALAGPYVLRVDFHPDNEWYERPVFEGVTLRTRRIRVTDPGDPQRVLRQSLSGVLVDLRTPGVRVAPVAADGCAPPAETAAAVGAVVAINGGFFDASCDPVSFLKIDGTLHASHTQRRSVLGVRDDGSLVMGTVAPGSDWPAVRHGLGGLPRVLTDGAIDVRTTAESVSEAFARARHPRSGVGIDPAGNLVLVAGDGRTPGARGLTLAELGAALQELGAESGVNVDGGGSTSLWVAGEPFGGVVSYPSDNGQHDHRGARAVANILAVWAPPLDRDILWLKTPSASGTLNLFVGDRFESEWMAADQDGELLRFEIETEGLPAELRLEDHGDGRGTLHLEALAATEAPMPIHILALPARGAPARYTLWARFWDPDAPAPGAPTPGIRPDAGVSTATSDAGTEALYPPAVAPPIALGCHHPRRRPLLPSRPTGWPSLMLMATALILRRRADRN